MDINKLSPLASSRADRGQAENSPVKKASESVQKQSRADALIADVRPEHSPESAAEAAKTLAGTLANRSDQALDAFGNMDEDRIHALLED